MAEEIIINGWKWVLDDGAKDETWDLSIPSLSFCVKYYGDDAGPHWSGWRILQVGCQIGDSFQYKTREQAMHKAIDFAKEELARQLQKAWYEFQVLQSIVKELKFKVNLTID